MSLTRYAPPVIPETGWILLPSFPSDGQNRPFLSGGEDRVRVAFFRLEDRDAVVGRAWFGPGAQGPPGSAHGGSIVAVLDEAMGACCWVQGYRVVAARLTTNFRKQLPLGTDATFEAWIERKDGRKVYGRAKLLDRAGDVLAEAEGLFIELTPEQLQEVMDRVHRPFAGPGA
jgi:acyl-coenzyme A thioesterase PaaI-like protein